MASNIRESLRGLVFSAQELATFNIFPQAFIEDYLTIVENLVKIADGVDTTSDKMDDNEQAIEGINAQALMLSSFTSRLSSLVLAGKESEADVLQVLSAIELSISNILAWVSRAQQATKKTTGEQGIIQIFYNGNVLNGFNNGDFQQVDLSLGATINEAATGYPYSARNKTIDDIVDSTANTLKYNKALIQSHKIRIIFDYTDKETNRNYNAVWKIKYPDGASPAFEENGYISLPRKNGSLERLVAVFFTLSTSYNITQNLELFIAIQDADDVDTGFNTNTNIILESITAFYGAVSGENNDN